MLVTIKKSNVNNVINYLFTSQEKLILKLPFIVTIQKYVYF